MTSPRLPVPFELHRIRHVRGERLLSADLRDALAIDAQFRWWHGRAQHESHGVARGLSVAAQPSPLGEPMVRVEAGLAYDCYGRELVLHAPRTLELPLALREQEIATLMLGAARPGGSPRSSLVAVEGVAPTWLTPDAELWWERSAHPDVRAGVPLVRATRALDSAWDLEPLSFRARPAARARIGQGTTVRGGTNWRPWTVNGGAVYLGVETFVNTGPAGFTGRPHYFADVVGSPIPPPLSDALAQVRGFTPAVPMLHLADDAPGGFRARILIPLGSVPEASRELIRLMYKRDVAIGWLGIEPPATSGCAEDPA